MSSDGSDILHKVALRVITRWLEGRHIGVVATGGRAGLGGRAVDLAFTEGATQHRVKVKADPYFGTDTAKAHNHNFIFYRANQDSFAFEAVADAATREPGWMFDSGATELFYYFIAIDQPLDEVSALLEESDEVFFDELQVERDELVVLPMDDVKEWFGQNFERYPTRPVRAGVKSAWYRLVPRADLQAAVSGVASRGPIFSRLKG